MNKIYRACTIILIAAAVPACGTDNFNQRIMDARADSLQTARAAHSQYANQCATSSAACQGDTTCVVSVAAICALSQPEINIEQPRLRSAGQEFAAAFSPIASLAQTGLQVWGAGWLVDRSGSNMVDLVNASGGLVRDVGGVLGGVQGPVDNSINVGGNLGDTDQSTDVGGNFGDTDNGTSIGRDQIGGDQRVGDDVEGSCIGDSCRNVSPGPIDQSDNGDDLILPDPEPDPEP